MVDGGGGFSMNLNASESQSSRRKKGWLSGNIFLLGVYGQLGLTLGGQFLKGF